MTEIKRILQRIFFGRAIEFLRNGDTYRSAELGRFEAKGLIMAGISIIEIGASLFIMFSVVRGEVFTFNSSAGGVIFAFATMIFYTNFLYAMRVSNLSEKLHEELNVTGDSGFTLMLLKDCEKLRVICLFNLVVSMFATGIVFAFILPI